MLYFGKPFNKKSSLWFLNWQREWGAQLGQKHLIFLQKFLRNEKFLNLGNFPQPWFWNRGWTPTTLLSICLCTANVGGLVVVRYTLSETTTFVPTSALFPARADSFWKGVCWTQSNWAFHVFFWISGMKMMFSSTFSKLVISCLPLQDPHFRCWRASLRELEAS